MRSPFRKPGTNRVLSSMSTTTWYSPVAAWNSLRSSSDCSTAAWSRTTVSVRNGFGMPGRPNSVQGQPGGHHHGYACEYGLQRRSSCQASTEIDRRTVPGNTEMSAICREKPVRYRTICLHLGSDEGSGRRRDRGRQGRRAHQVLVDGGRAGPTLGDRPHDQALAAAHVAAHEHVVDVGGVARRRGRRWTARRARRRAGRAAGSPDR